jgi:hypothetical protein
MMSRKSKEAISLPIFGTTYYYIRANIHHEYFEVVQAYWYGGITDKFRFVRNFFLDEREANDVCDELNATLGVLVQPYKERIKHANGRGHKDVIVLNNKYYEQKENERVDTD